MAHTERCEKELTMSKKTTVLRIGKTGIDIAMAVLFLLLMGYQLLDGKIHEWLGVSLFVSFIVHNVFNYKWYTVLFNGKYNAVRILHTIVNVLLWIAMIGCVFSSMCISMYIFSGLNIQAAFIGRRLHLVSTVWAFLLMSLHLGFHWSVFVGLAKKKAHPQKTLSLVLKWVFRIIVLGVCIWGCFNFAVRKMWEEMFLLTEFKFLDYDKNIVLYFFESLSIMILFVSVSYYLKKGMLHARKGSQS